MFSVHLSVRQVFYQSHFASKGNVNSLWFAVKTVVTFFRMGNKLRKEIDSLKSVKRKPESNVNILVKESDKLDQETETQMKIDLTRVTLTKI